jgi:hypothetical protein
MPLMLFIAGLSVRIDSRSQLLLDRLSVRYHGFTRENAVHDRPAPFEVLVVLDSGSPPQDHPAPDAKFSEERIIFNLPGYRGTIDPEASAELTIASHTPVRGVDYFLRVVLSALAYRSGGLLLHAAGIVRDGRAFLFFGRSGSGKTTVARNAPGDLVLNDDLVLLQPESGRWMAYGTPFTNPSQTRPSAGSAPAAALLRLVQSQQVLIEPLTGARALAELVACVPVLNASPAPPLERCRMLLLSVPAYDLHLRPDPSFWEVIETIES